MSDSRPATAMGYDEERWRRGRAAGMTGGPMVPPRDVVDGLAYVSGYILRQRCGT